MIVRGRLSCVIKQEKGHDPPLSLAGTSSDAIQNPSQSLILRQCFFANCHGPYLNKPIDVLLLSVHETVHRLGSSDIKRGEKSNGMERDVCWCVVTFSRHTHNAKRENNYSGNISLQSDLAINGSKGKVR